MIVNSLHVIFRRDLLKLKLELEQYSHEEDIWRIAGSVLNSAGNLTLHLIGNLNTYIGAELGKTGYIRDRPKEFSIKNIPREELIYNIMRTMEMLEKVLPSLTEEQLLREYPQETAEGKVSTQHFLIHLATHLNYHLGQVNYHRRLQTQ